MASKKVEDALEKINNLLNNAFTEVELIEGEHPDLTEFTNKLDEIIEEFARIADEM